MNVLCGGDLHIRVTNPEHRIDDFVETQKHKIKWIERLIDKYNCQLALYPGDITDHSKLPYWIVDYYTRLFKLQFECERLTVRGQHDMLYHVESSNTPISLMDAAGAIKLISIQDVGGYFMLPNVVVWGIDFDGIIPDVRNFGYDKKMINILLIHKMFVDEKIWEGQEDYKRANLFLKETEWDLIVSGDNHQHFMFQSGDRYHVNCGSLMRQNIDQIHHKPIVYIYNTENKTLVPHYVPIDPPEEVFSVEEALEKKKEDEKMKEFVEMVKYTTKIEGLDYAKNLDGRMSENDISDELMELHKEVMKNVGERLGNK